MTFKILEDDSLFCARPYIVGPCTRISVPTIEITYSYTTMSYNEPMHEPNILVSRYILRYYVVGIYSRDVYSTHAMNGSCFLMVLRLREKRLEQ